MQLKYILYKDIDFEKWDNSLAKCSNRLIYAEAAYLNTMCKQWNAIVSIDYEYIMPVPVKRKMAIQYVPMTPFVQQLGIFSSKLITPYITESFVTLLTGKINLINYNLNHQNTLQSTVARKCNNYILPLNYDYEIIRKDFKKDFSKYLKTTELEISFDEDYTTAIQFFRQEYKNRDLKITEEQYGLFNTICGKLQQQQRVIVAKATYKGKLLASALILKDERRLYNICSTISAEGKKHTANHFLFDSLIQKFAGTQYLLDFEGSDVEGIAHFYQSMGGTNYPYQYIEMNQLPALIKLIKK